jgi:hypothetical protein
MQKSIIIATVAAILAGGCVVVPTYEVYRPVPAPPPPPEPEVVVAGPVFEAPGVEIIDVEPAPYDRVYVYDPGYPPGCYFYGGFYWYGGYRYPHDVFIQRYVTVNVRENRYINVEENRRSGMRIEEQHRVEFARNHGVRSDRVERPGEGRPSDRAGRPGDPRASDRAGRPGDPHQTPEQRQAAMRRQADKDMNHY